MTRRDNRYLPAAREVEKAFRGRIFRTPFGTFPSLVDHRGLRHAWWLAREWSGRRASADEAWARRLTNWSGRYKPKSPLQTADLLCGVAFRGWEVVAAVRLLAQERGIPYWVDLQDPLEGTAGIGEAVLSDEQIRPLRDAKQIVTTTDAYAAHLRETLPQEADKIECLRLTRNISARTGANSAPNDGRLVLVHAGHLYGLPDRSAVPVLQAMARLYDKVPFARGKVTLRLVGSGPGMHEAVAEANKLGVRQDLECLPAMPPDAMNRYVDGADVLCVLKSAVNRRDYQLPGKTYDYLFSNKPVLAVTFPGELATIIEETGSGFVVNPGDVERMASVLGQLLEQKQAVGSVAQERDPDKLRPYSFETFRQKLERVLTSSAPAGPGLPPGI